MKKEQFDKAYDLLSYILREEIWELRSAVYCVGYPDACTPDQEKALKYANDVFDLIITDLNEVKEQLNKTEEP